MMRTVTQSLQIGVVSPLRGDAETLSVEFSCRWCGELLALTTLDNGGEIVDREGFLARHDSCLRQAMRRGPDLRWVDRAWTADH